MKGFTKKNFLIKYCEFLYLVKILKIIYKTKRPYETSNNIFYNIIFFLLIFWGKI